MYALLKRLAEALKALQVLLSQIAPPPAYDQNPNELPMNQPNKAKLLEDMLAAIQAHEGWFPGSRSYRNNNPGNLRHAGQPKAIGKDDKNFAIFANYADGKAALRNMILNAARGGSKIYGPDFNLYEFFAKYAPSNDNNDPVRYADVVAKRMGVNPATFKLRDLL